MSCYCPALSGEDCPLSVAECSARIDAAELALASRKRFPFMLRPGVWVYLDLPIPLTQRDVARIELFLRTLTFDDPQVAPRSVGDP